MKKLKYKFSILSIMILSLLRIVLLLFMLIPFANAYTNSITCTGDSMVATGGSPSFCSQLGTYYGLTVYQTGISGACLSDYGSCSTRNPLVDRVASSINTYDSKFIIIHSNINDNGVDIPLEQYEIDYQSVIDQITGDGTIILTTMPNAEYDLGHFQYRFANMSQIVRELAIRNELPLLELHYELDHAVDTYTADGTHYNQAGHNYVYSKLSPILSNYSNYVMTMDNWDFYYDCNKTQTVLNFTIDAPANNCIKDVVDGQAQDWIVLKNINGANFTIDRKDNNFYISLENKFEANTQYYMKDDGTIINTITSDSNGSYNNLLITALEGSRITFLKLGELEVYNTRITINAITNSVSIYGQNDGRYFSTTNNVINWNSLVWGDL